MTRGQTLDLAELPIACTLDGSAAGDRLERWRALAERARPTLRREADRIVVAYPLTQTVRVELEALAAAERRCCAFAQREVVQDDNHVLLHITATPDGLDAIGVFVAAERAAGDSRNIAAGRA